MLYVPRLSSDTLLSVLPVSTECANTADVPPYKETILVKGGVCDVGVTVDKEGVNEPDISDT